MDGSYVWAGHQKDQTVIKGLEFSDPVSILLREEGVRHKVNN